MNIGSISLTGLSSQAARAAADAQEETAKAQVAAQGQQQLQSPADSAAQAPLLEAQQLIAAATGVGGKVNTYA